MRSHPSRLAQVGAIFTSFIQSQSDTSEVRLSWGLSSLIEGASIPNGAAV